MFLSRTTMPLPPVFPVRHRSNRQHLTATHLASLETRDGEVGERMCMCTCVRTRASTYVHYTYTSFLRVHGRKCVAISGDRGVTYSTKRFIMSDEIIVSRFARSRECACVSPSPPRKKTLSELLLRTYGRD